MELSNAIGPNWGGIFKKLGTWDWIWGFKRTGYILGKELEEVSLIELGEALGTLR